MVKWSDFSLGGKYGPKSQKRRSKSGKIYYVSYKRVPYSRGGRK